jgi:glycosyltransferase involved in cell wall biosynthesis
MPHLIYSAWGYPPAAKSSAYRLLATANSFARHGWNVTVMTPAEDAWERESGLDRSLLGLVDPGIDVVRLPLYRHDIDTDIRRYSAFRALRPAQYRSWRRRFDQFRFPEPTYGPWRPLLEKAADEIHAAKPADLVVATAAPYTFFVPALHLGKNHGVPFVLDYRDGWALDVINGGEVFPVDSRRGRIERWLIDHAAEAWFVNRPIRDWYAARYPDADDRLQVVRNGSDPDISVRAPVRSPDAANGLTIGYLGNITFSPVLTKNLCEAWRLARRQDELVARSRLVFRGYIGIGSARGANAHTKIMNDYAKDGVSYDGPVPKAETGDVYASWDALLFCVQGGRYVTSGKVYDYMSTGMPIMSAHEQEHAAVDLLEGYPLWVRNAGLEVADLVEAFIRTAHLAVDATDVDHKAAREYGESFERYRQIDPAVVRLTERFGQPA